MITHIVLYIVLVAIILCLAYNRKESLLQPWEVGKCRLKCWEQGQQIPWNGGPDGPWENPASFPSSNFDVAGCMAKCALQTWYEK